MKAFDKPRVFSYCATFLPPEMWHVYRQVGGLSEFESWVVTRRRDNCDLFPWERVLVLPKSPLRFLNRMRYRLTGDLVRLSGFETRHLQRLVQEHRPVVLHAYLGSEALRIIDGLRSFPAGRVVSFHGGDLSEQFDAKRYRELWPHVELVLCRSESLKEELLKRNCPSDRIRIHRTGVPVPELEPDVRCPDWRSGKRIELLQVCRLIRKKGLDVTVTAAKRLIDEGKRVRLTIAGEGPQREALGELTRALGMDEHVEFAGFASGSDLESLFHRSHLFVHPSRTTKEGDREGIPNSLLEAMAHGLPVVATRHSGIPEAVQDGATGRLIADAEPEGLATAIKDVIDDARRFNELSRRGRRAVQERFSLTINRLGLEALYREALALRRSER